MSVYGELFKKGAEAVEAGFKRILLTLAILAVCSLVVMGLAARYWAKSAWEDGFKTGYRAGVMMERGRPHPKGSDTASPISCPPPETP